MYELHRLGWSSFQQLCLTIARKVPRQTVLSFLYSNDAVRDGAFTDTWTPADAYATLDSWELILENVKLLSRDIHNGTHH